MPLADESVKPKFFPAGDDKQVLLDLVPAGLQQGSLFAPDLDPERSGRLMEALDRINRTFGRQTIRFASEALSDQWRMRARLKSPTYTTRWDELPRVQAR